MDICWPTRSRTGSTFIVQLTSALFSNEELMPQARINGYRVDTYKKEEKQGDFKDAFNLGDAMSYIKENGIKSMKYEDAAKDDFILALAEEYPSLKFVASYRPIEMVINSHYNIKSWGHDEADVLYNFSCGLYLYEKLYRMGRLYMIDVASPSEFKSEKFLSFLGKEANKRFNSLVKEWKPINTLEYQIDKYSMKFKHDIQVPPRLAKIKEIHDWIPNFEMRYKKICC